MKIELLSNLNISAFTPHLKRVDNDPERKNLIVEMSYTYNNCTQRGKVTITKTFTWDKKKGHLYFVFDFTPYEQNEVQKIHQLIDIERKPSNLGIGYRYYFMCAETGRLCTKLYLINNQFTGRTKDMLYHTQTMSHSDRIYKYNLGTEQRAQDEIYQAEIRKDGPKSKYHNRKRHYKGQMTKWRAKLQNEFIKQESGVNRLLPFMQAQIMVLNEKHRKWREKRSI